MDAWPGQAAAKLSNASLSASLKGLSRLALKPENGKLFFFLRSLSLSLSSFSFHLAAMFSFFCFFSFSMLASFVQSLCCNSTILHLKTAAHLCKQLRGGQSEVAEERGRWEGKGDSPFGPWAVNRQYVIKVAAVSVCRKNALTYFKCACKIRRISCAPLPLSLLLCHYMNYSYLLPLLNE